jgi:predicted RNA-binding Zn ribbon-like protein
MSYAQRQAKIERFQKQTKKMQSAQAKLSNAVADLREVVDEYCQTTRPPNGRMQITD